MSIPVSGVHRIGASIHPAALVVAALLNIFCAHGPAEPEPMPTPVPSPTPAQRFPLPTSGLFALTVSVQPGCQDDFPDSFRVRVYSVLIEALTDHSVFTILDNADVQPSPYGSSRYVGQGYVEDGAGALRFDFIEERPLETPPSFSYFVNTGSDGLALSTERLEGHLYGQIGYTDPSVSASCMGSHDFLLSK